MKKPNLITFDWDGTLLDTRDCVVTNMNKILAAYGQPSWKDAKKLRDSALSLKGNFPNFFGERYKEAYGDYLVEYRASMQTLLKKIDGTDSLLRFLNESGITIGIISNKEPSLLEEERDFFFPDISFALIYGDGTASRNKPFPDPIDKAIETLGLDKENTVIWHVGDTMQDINAASKAGVTPVLIKQYATFKEDTTEDDIIAFDDIPSFFNHVQGIIKP